ncbi:MAG: hypothetical protein OXD36_10585 [Rhodobacter sp.]|nr:hypothetical protein [Rhodobacter sp.]
MTTKRVGTVTAVLAATAILAGCGGGGGGPDIDVVGPPLPDIDANSIQISDMHLRLPDGSRERVAISCAPSGSCRATVGRQTIEFDVDGNDDAGGADGVGTIWNTLGDWSDMGAGAIYARLDGASARYAAAFGVVRPDSLPLQGSATWRGDMVGLDANNRSVRGGAELAIPDLSDPLVDVTLTPRARAAMRWRGLPVRDGGFSEELRRDDYIRGEFYGRRAGEAGGVFERNGIVGAFGAERE